MMSEEKAMKLLNGIFIFFARGKEKQNTYFFLWKEVRICKNPEKLDICKAMI